jgi:putative aminopeptidase FrvX
MLRDLVPLRPCLVLAVVLGCGLGSNAENVRFSPIAQADVENNLRKYSGDNRQRETTLRQMFADAGCDQHLSEQPVKGSKLPNVICVLPGGSERQIIVGAHFDRVSDGDGVVDNWSGASLLPALYQAVKTEPRKHGYIFIGFTDEESGLRGSRFYSHQMTADQVAATDAMVNMDTLGLGPPEIWATHSDSKLTSALVFIAENLKVSLTGVNVERIGATTDAEPFFERKIPRITIHSLSQKAWDDNILHTSKDKISAMHSNDYYQTYRLIAAYLALLDQVVGPAPAPRTGEP